MMPNQLCKSTSRKSVEGDFLDKKHAPTVYLHPLSDMLHIEQVE